MLGCDDGTTEVVGLAPDGGRSAEGCVLNECGLCGATPQERCDGVLNDCGECGEVPPESCNMVDDDCDGSADEGVANACGGCGAVPEESCNGVDDDCDGPVDEGETNACGRCGEVPVEACNGRDDDCDGRTDEEVANACGGCGALSDDVCDLVDNDCDGLVDEDGDGGTLRNACGDCGPAPAEECNERDDDCDGETDEFVTNACGGCGDVPVEVCDDDDNDCDGATDEGFARNRCGTCGEAPLEVCDRADNDCDGATDEDLPRNLCGVCGPAPEEVCDGADNDCDEAVDEGHVLNSCGECGADPPELCIGADDDCDEAADEDFSVGRSLAHCAGCDRPCAVENGTPACLAGECVVIACDIGFRDVDLDPVNGCESQLPEGRVYHVDGDAEPGGDGSLERPYRRITDATEEPELTAGDTILVRPGDYPELVELGTAGVTLRSQVRHGARVLGGDGRDAAVLVSGEQAVVTGFEVVVGHNARGIQLECEAGCVVSDNRVTGGVPADGTLRGIFAHGVGMQILDNEVDDVVGADFPASRQTGIYVVDSTNAVVAGNLVRRLRPRPTARGEGATRDGTTVVGIEIVRTVAVRVRANTVAELSGSDGLGVLAPVTSGNGGGAFGLYIEGSREVVVDGGGERDGERNAVRDLVGGRAGQPSASDDRIGRPGGVLGIVLFDCDAVTLVDVRMERLSGGTGRVRALGRGQLGGAVSGVLARGVSRLTATRVEMVELRGGIGAAGAPSGASHGWFVDEPLSDVDVRASNTVEGDPVFLTKGIDNVQAVGLEMRAPVRSTNLGRIVVIGGRDARIEGNTVVGPEVVAGRNSAEAVTTDGGDAVGIHVSDVRGVVRVRGNRVSRVPCGGVAIHRHPAGRGPARHGVRHRG